VISHVKELNRTQQVTLLDISIQNITELPPGLFDHINKGDLSGLVISSGHLSGVSEESFLGLEHQLTSLGLPNNEIKTIPVQAVSSLVNLSRLDVSGNQISLVTSFPSLPSLEYVDLSRNRIKMIASGVFQSVPHLQTLLLSENNLETNDLFHYNMQSLSYLSTVDLSTNKLSGNVKPPMFDLFPPNLNNLDLSFNKVGAVRKDSFQSLTGLEHLNLQGNLLEEIEDFAFLGLVSLTELDLSHNNILTLSTESLTGLISLHTLIISHNHLQVVSPTWMTGTPLLQSLMAMDNDISMVEDNALHRLSNLTDVNLAGNPLSCDCQSYYFYSWLHNSPHPLSNSTLKTALCATPLSLTNSPLYDISQPSPCPSTAEDHCHDSLLSSKEIQLASSQFDRSNNVLNITWNIEPDVLPYRCGQLHVFVEKITEGVVLVTHDNLTCNWVRGKMLITDINIDKYKLSSTSSYIFCISLLKGSSVIPGCSGPLNISSAVKRETLEVESGSSLIQINKYNLYANVTASGTSLSMSLKNNISQSLMRNQSCMMKVTVNIPKEAGSSHNPLQTRTVNCSQEETVNFINLPCYTHYNVCVDLQLTENIVKCQLISSSQVIHREFSVLPILLTLIFLVLTIACLTVIYLHMKKTSGNYRLHRLILHLSNICRKLKNKSEKSDLLLNDVDDGSS